jgi:formylglycine-generating enzyme required for sulfatase activity
VAVGSFAAGASWIGVLDMAGNAMEWVADWWSDTYYAESPPNDPAGPALGIIKIEKGGWWGPADDSGAFVGRSAFRLDEDMPTYQDHHIGFRIVTDS